MSIIAQMDGLPASIDSESVVIAVKKILRKLKIRYWVSDFAYSEQTKTNKCKIKFFSKEDSTKAINKITSKPQNIIGIPCDVKITIVSENAKESIKEGNEERARSRSPISKEKANINKELERLKKEKEELEKRKSELLKKKMDIDQKDTKTDDKNCTSKIHQLITATLPKCPAAEIAIIEEMKPLAKPYVQKRFYQNLMQRLQVEVRTKLAILLESGLRKTSPVKQIVETYRDKYPKENDSQVVENIVRQVKMAFWAYKAKKREGTNNSEPYEYDESEEEDTTGDNQGVTTVVKSNNGHDNKMDITEDDVTSQTKDTMTPTTEGDDEVEGGEELEGVDEEEGGDETEYGYEAEGDIEAEGGNAMNELSFEGGTEWNEEDNEVSS